MSCKVSKSASSDNTSTWLLNKTCRPTIDNASEDSAKLKVVTTRSGLSRRRPTAAYRASLRLDGLRIRVNPCCSFSSRLPRRGHTRRRALGARPGAIWPPATDLSAVGLGSAVCDVMRREQTFGPTAGWGTGTRLGLCPSDEISPRCECSRNFEGKGNWWLKRSGVRAGGMCVLARVWICSWKIEMPSSELKKESGAFEILVTKALDG